jgi:hypothetical protein
MQLHGLSGDLLLVCLENREVTGLLLHILTPARTRERESNVWEKKRGERDASAASRKERKEEAGGGGLGEKG